MKRRLRILYGLLLAVAVGLFIAAIWTSGQTGHHLASTGGVLVGVAFVLVSADWVMALMEAL